MKRLFEILGLLSLVFFSIYYSEQITTVVKTNDELMKEIENVSLQYKTESINALINNNTIIPGVSGNEIDIDESYDAMKRAGGVFNDNLLIYKTKRPDISIENNYDKYIVSGNKNLKNTTLSFILDENDAYDKILYLLNKYEIKGNFFVTEKYLDNNNDVITDLINDKHVVGIIAGDVKWMDNVIEDYLNQQQGFCLETSNLILNECSKENNYTIKPNIVINENPLIEVKNYLNTGSIITFEITEQLITQLESIINHINSKGITVVTLEQLIKE